VLVILAFEIFVICKATGSSPSRRHLFLGQTLLLGLLLGSCVGFAYAVEPNEFSCAAVRLGTGLSYGLIYTSLLVKQNFLISLNNGVYLPASYQVLLFLFAIITQVVIGVFWLSISTVFQISLCDYSSGEHMLALLYVIFLILFVSGLAVKSWHCRDNYRESKYIGILMAVTIPSWLAWLCSAIVLNESFGPPCFGFGLIFVCMVTFVVMFVPKSRQLSAIGKEGIYLEDHVVDPVDDRFSFRSNDANNYSPSFYHFRPSKTSVSRRSGSIHKEFRSDSPFYKAGNSYTGFHRPLRVVPPTAASPQPPPSYSARTPYFPSHFFPEKLHQYWQYYYPRIPDVYRRPPGANGDFSIYTSLYDPDRAKSANPNVYFYKTAGYPTGFIY